MDIVKQLQERFGLITPTLELISVPPVFTNLNWYIKSPKTFSIWFWKGDVTEDDISLLPKMLKGDETLSLGWQDLAPNKKWDDIHGDGGEAWLLFIPGKIVYDRRYDRTRLTQEA